VFACQTRRAARTRSIWLSSRRPSQGNHPTSHVEEAASVAGWPLKTAWQGLFTHGHLEKGQHDPDPWWPRRCGRLCGAIGIACRRHRPLPRQASDDEAYLNSIGASRVIDYREEHFEKVLREEVDVVFDLVGGDAQKRSFLVLKEGGHLVSAVQPVSQEEAADAPCVGRDDAARAVRDVLSRIGRLLEEGQYDQTSRPCTRSRMWPRPGRTSPRKLPRVHGCRPVAGAPRRKKHGKIVLRLASGYGGDRSHGRHRSRKHDGPVVARRSASTRTVDEHLAGLSPGCVAIDLSSRPKCTAETARAGLFPKPRQRPELGTSRRGIDTR